MNRDNKMKQQWVWTLGTEYGRVNVSWFPLQNRSSSKRAVSRALKVELVAEGVMQASQRLVLQESPASDIAGLSDWYRFAVNGLIFTVTAG